MPEQDATELELLQEYCDRLEMILTAYGHKLPERQHAPERAQERAKVSELRERWNLEREASNA